LRGDWLIIFCAMHGSRKVKTNVCPECMVPGEWVLERDQATRLGRLLTAIVENPELIDLHVRKDGSVDVIKLVYEVRKRTSKFDFLQPVHIRMLVETAPGAQYQLNGCNLRVVARDGGEK